MHHTKFILGMLFSLAVVNPLYGDGRSSEHGLEIGLEGTPGQGAVESESVVREHTVPLYSAKQPPLKPYPRLLPLHLKAPDAARAGVPFDDINVRLTNPGQAAPNARLRLILHDQNHQPYTHPALSPDNVKLELWRRGLWEPVELGMVEGSVMGAIGNNGGSGQHERHKRGGFPIGEGASKIWRLRMTITVPGTYSLVAAVSPDNGSRHLAKPVNAVIVVQ